MSKKFLSVLLAVLMAISSVSCLFTATTVTASAEGKNLMANIKASDWTSGWNGSSGVDAELGIAVRAAWRSVYTKVTLNPEAKHTLSFSFGQVRVGDVRVYPASEITDPSTQLISVGSAPATGGTTNLATDTLTTNCPKTPVDGAFYKGEETFKTTTETEYYIILDCYQNVNTTSVILKDLSLTQHPYDPNVLAEATINDWATGWTGTSPVMDGEDIKIGGAYHSFYIKVNLKAYTPYTFSLVHRNVAVSDIRVYAASEITDASTQLANSSAAVIGGTNNLSTGTKTYSPELSGSGLADSTTYYTASESFTTTSGTEYYIIIDGNAGVADNYFRVQSASLIEDEINPNADIVDPENWKVTATYTATATEDGKGVTVSAANWRDSYAQLKLTPNTTYDLSFNYKGGAISNIVIIAAKDSSYTSGAHICNQLKAGATACFSQYVGGYTYSTDTWTNISFTFTTNEDCSYYLIFDHGANTTGYTASDFNFKVNNSLLATSTATDWTSSWGGAKGTASNGAISVRAAYRSAYTKVTLEPNTKYNLTFNHGEVRVTDIRVFAASEITDASTQLISGDNGGAAPGGTNNLATSAVITNCPEAPVAGEFYTSSETFTTGTEAEYYILIDCGAFSTTAILLKNLDLSPYVYDANTDIVDPSNWESTWNISNPGAATFTSTTDSCEGGKAIYVNKSNYRSSFALITLKANTTYDLSFNYKGTSEIAAIQVIAENDIDATKYAGAPMHLISSMKDGASAIYSENVSGLTYDNATWNKVSISFTTNDNTKYYLVLQHGANSGFTASDFSFVAKETSSGNGVVVGENILANIANSDLVSTWDSTTGSTATTIAVKNAWHSAYTKVTLEPYTNYDFTFKAANVKLSNVRVYAASEITDASTQLNNSGAAVTGGTNNLVSSVTSTVPSDDYTTADESIVSAYYDVSVAFATTADTEYYIIVDGGQFPSNGALYATFMYFKSFSLIAGEKVYIDPNVLSDANMKKLTWNAVWSSGLRNAKTDLDNSASYSGSSYAMSWDRNSRYRDNYTTVTLEPNTKYQLSFYYKASGTEEIVQDIGFVASSAVDFTTLVGDYVKDHLIDSTTTILGKADAVIPQATNGTWNQVTTTFTTGAETEYIMYISVGAYIDNSFSTITLSDFSLLEYVDPNKLSEATVANGDVRWSVGDDSEEDYITGAEGKEDELVTYTNANGEEVTRSRVYYYDEQNAAYNYNGGYAWRIILSSETAMAVYNPAVYGYITARGLAADTTYTFSYIYNDSYHIKLGDIYNADGSLDISDTTTKMLPDKEGSTAHYYMVTTNFTTGAEGDYTIKLQTGRSNKYYIYDGSSWALTLSDLSLVKYEAVDTPDIPDDANILETPADLKWGTTWYDVEASEDGYNGTPAISTSGIHYHGIYTMLELEPNTEYNLSFKYKSRGAIDVIGIADAESINLANVNDKFSSAFVSGTGSLTYYQNIEKVIDATTWNTATAKFVTGDNTAYYLYLEGNSAANAEASGATVISAMSLTKALDTTNAKKVYYDFEDGNIGAISTTSASDAPSVAEENGNKYLSFTKTNDGITVPFYYNGNQRYVVSFDMKVLSYPTDNTLEMRFAANPDDNNGQYNEGNVFTYRNEAYSLVTKDMEGNLLSGPSGLNYSENYQFNGFKQTFTEGTDWVHYEITIDPDYTYYTGLASFGFSSADAGWSIALDNIKVSALDDGFEQNAKNNFAPVQYAAIRQRTVGVQQGIRVKSSIDTSLLSGDIKVVEYGTLAIKNEKLQGKELIYDMVNNDTYNAKIGVAYSADNGTDVSFSVDGTVVTYTGVLIGLKDYATEYAVRGYMIVETADGERFVIYEEDTKAVSVYDVVYAILNDGEENDDDTAANEVVSKNQEEYDSWVAENYPEETLTASKTVSLSINNSAAPVITNYRGFSGTVYHAYGFMEDDTSGRVYTDEMRDTELDRLEAAGVHYVRTRYQSQWIFDDATGYDWSSDRFGYFCNYAKALQERDMEVILQVGWHFDFVSQDGTYSIHENDYFNGEGEDRYGESAGVDFTGKSDEDIRIIKAARRYGYMMANTLKYAKAKGINNIKYFSYFVEPSNSYSDTEDQWFLEAGHDKETYVLFCRTMRDMLEDEYGVTDIKHMGPNEAGYSKLIDYVLKNDPSLFDILSAHNYPQEGNVQTNYDTYYDTMTNNTNYNILNGYFTDFNDYKDFLATAKANSGNNDIEFWSDEFNIKDFGSDDDARGSSSAYRGLATAMGGIIAQQSGIQNTILWMSYDQLWTDRTGGDSNTVSEFMNGIHQCGNAPSLFLSDQPYAQYYPTGLFSKYNGYKNGTVYATNLSETEQEGVYVGAVQLEDGSWTVTVLNMNSTAINIDVAFGAAINQTLYRHTYVASNADSYTDAVLPGVDKTFDNVGTTFSDTLAAGSLAIYTGVEG